VSWAVTAGNTTDERVATWRDVGLSGGFEERTGVWQKLDLAIRTSAQTVSGKAAERRGRLESEVVRGTFAGYLQQGKEDARRATYPVSVVVWVWCPTCRSVTWACEGAPRNGGYSDEVLGVDMESEHGDRVRLILGKSDDGALVPGESPFLLDRISATFGTDGRPSNLLTHRWAARRISSIVPKEVSDTLLGEVLDEAAGRLVQKPRRLLPFLASEEAGGSHNVFFVQKWVPARAFRIRWAVHALGRLARTDHEDIGVEPISWSNSNNFCDLDDRDLDRTVFGHDDDTDL
jgi:hypothetical protein